jgi:2-isopropylmalate synthase
MLPHQAYQTTAEAVSAAAAWRRPGATPCAIGIHAHDDSGCAVANTLEAVRAGATHVQGTVNGYGERVGNADLLTAVADMELKLGIEVIGRERLKGFTSLARYVAEAFNIAPDAHQPYVGASAFTHKGGLHASGSERLPGAYEHVNPEAVGNLAHVVISDLAGKASLKNKAAELGIALPAGETGLAELLAALKSREARGFSYEMADASLALFVQGELGCATQAFRLESFRVIADKHADGRVMCEATIKIHVGGERHVATAEGNGPVNALDKALRMAIRRFYPQIDCLHLSDYKVRVLDESIGTGAVTRVGIVTTDGERSWGTIGVSENIIEASWDALVDSISFALQ